MRSAPGLEKLGPLRSSLLLASLFLLPLLSNASSCVEPGSCTPPASDYSRVIDGPKPGQQWNINGGFCGAWSIQQSAKAFGAWVSQDLVRKANRDQSIPHFMHGDAALGYEVVPSNQAYTAEKLKLTFDEFDYTQPAPQAAAWKAFVKGHLVRGEPGKIEALLLLLPPPPLYYTHPNATARFFSPAPLRQW